MHCLFSCDSSSRSPPVCPSVCMSVRNAFLNFKTLQHCNFVTLQLCNIATLQLCNIAILQLYNVETLQHYNIATLQHFNIATFQLCNFKSLHYCNFKTLQHYDIATLQHYKFATFQLVNITNLQLCHIAGLLDRPSGLTDLDRSAGRISWTDQLDGPADRPAGQTSSFYLKPWPVRIFKDFPFSLYIVAATESDKGLVCLSHNFYISTSFRTIICWKKRIQQVYDFPQRL